MEGERKAATTGATTAVEDEGGVTLAAAAGTRGGWKEERVEGERKVGRKEERVEGGWKEERVEGVEATGNFSQAAATDVTGSR